MLIRPRTRELLLAANMFRCSPTAGVKQRLGRGGGCVSSCIAGIQSWHQSGCLHVCHSHSFDYSFYLYIYIYVYKKYFFFFFLRKLAAFSLDLFRYPAGFIKVRVLDVDYIYFKNTCRQLRCTTEYKINEEFIVYRWCWRFCCVGEAGCVRGKSVVK